MQSCSLAFIFAAAAAGSAAAAAAAAAVAAAAAAAPSLHRAALRSCCGWYATWWSSGRWIMLGRRDQRSELLRPLSERSRDSKGPSSRYPFWRGLHFPILKDLCVCRSVHIGEWTASGRVWWVAVWPGWLCARERYLAGAVSAWAGTYSSRKHAKWGLNTQKKSPAAPSRFLSLKKSP